ncbi:MAG: pectin esterase [Phycisphaerales bacterium]|nr:pectin esterase [Phycisphaerales bacterium]
MIVMLAFSAPFARADEKPAAGPVSFVVAADGSGDFRGVQEAINAVPAGNAQRVVIHIRPGLYRGQVVVPRDKRLISIVGEAPDKTLITETWNLRTIGKNGLPLGVFGAATFIVLADDFEAENITFENASGNHGQAPAVSVSGDRAAFHRCNFMSWQDTLLLNQGRQFFDSCYVCGSVDFIAGGATAFFESCRLHCLTGGYITAACTPQEQAYGFVFSKCQITAGPDRYNIFLGRPWRSFANVTFLRTEMPVSVDEAGWDNWRVPEREKTARFAEYHSTGLGAHASSRAAWSKQLTDEQAKEITKESVLRGKDGWDPKAVGEAAEPVATPAK